MPSAARASWWMAAAVPMVESRSGRAAPGARRWATSASSRLPRMTSSTSRTVAAGPREREDGIREDDGTAPRSGRTGRTSGRLGAGVPATGASTAIARALGLGQRQLEEASLEACLGGIGVDDRRQAESKPKSPTRISAA